MIIPTDTPKGRYYPWDGDKYISVTTAISEGIPKPGLNRWFVRNVAEIAAKNRKKLAAFKRQPEAKEWLLDLHYGDKDNSAAILGSNVHALCEKVALADGPIVLSDDDPAVPFMLHYYAFIEEYKPVFIETEATVFSREHGYAGTMDLLVEIAGKLYIVDIKTGKGVWPEAALQVAAYRYADFIGRKDGKEDKIPKVSGGLVFHLRSDGLNIIPVNAGPETFDTFLSALDIFRWQKIDGKHAIGEAWE